MRPYFCPIRAMSSSVALENAAVPLQRLTAFIQIAIKSTQMQDLSSDGRFSQWFFSES